MWARVTLSVLFRSSDVLVILRDESFCMIRGELSLERGGQHVIRVDLKVVN